MAKAKAPYGKLETSPRGTTKINKNTPPNYFRRIPSFQLWMPLLLQLISTEQHLFTLCLLEAPMASKPLDTLSLLPASIYIYILSSIEISVAEVTQLFHFNPKLVILESTYIPIWHTSSLGLFQLAPYNLKNQSCPPPPPSPASFSVCIPGEYQNICIPADGAFI